MPEKRNIWKDILTEEMQEDLGIILILVIFCIINVIILFDLYPLIFMPY